MKRLQSERSVETGCFLYDRKQTRLRVGISVGELGDVSLLTSIFFLRQVNLAVADVLIALCCMWPHLVNDLTKPAFILGAFMCKFNAFAQSKFCA